jgi:hypothetical protein
MMRGLPGRSSTLSHVVFLLEKGGRAVRIEKHAIQKERATGYRMNELVLC